MIKSKQTDTETKRDNLKSVFKIAAFKAVTLCYIPFTSTASDIKLIYKSKTEIIKEDSILVSNVSSTSSWKSNQRYLIDSFGKLPDNWNFNGAEHISINVLTLAKDLVSKLNHKPDIFPTGRNSVQFEYENDEFYFEVEVFDNSIITLFNDYRYDTSENKLFTSIIDISNYTNSTLNEFRKDRTRGVVI